MRLKISSSTLQHSTIYIPWQQTYETTDEAVSLTQALARHADSQIVVISHTKSNIPERLAKAGYITLKSATAPRAATVGLLFYPDARLIDRLPRDMRYLVALEYPDYSMRTWAARRGAWDAIAGQAMTLEIDDETKALYDRILWNGNNGWRDEWGKSDALRHLRALRGAGKLDKEELIGYLSGAKDAGALETLAKLIDQVQ